MEKSIKKRFFWEEILEIIPFGVSLRTFSDKPSENFEIERVLGYAESPKVQRYIKREPDKTKKFFKGN